MHIKTLVKGVSSFGPKVMAHKRGKLHKLELLLEVAKFIPHPAVRMLTRSAGSGLVIYRSYQRLKQLKPSSKLK